MTHSNLDIAGKGGAHRQADRAFAANAVEPAPRLDPAGLQSLARRCEQAAGPDRELDAEIAIAIDAPGELGEASAREIMAGSPRNTVADLAKGWPRLKRYTASVDLALGLAPAGTFLTLCVYPDGMATAGVDYYGGHAGARHYSTPALAVTGEALLVLCDSDTRPKDGDAKQAPLASSAAIARKADHDLSH